MKRLMVRMVWALAIFAFLAIGASSGGSTAASAAGWYGPYQDGCFYYWDGQQFTGYDCTASSFYGWYGPYEDGCYYLWDGYQFISVDCSMVAMTVSTIGGDSLFGEYTISNFTPGTGVSTTGGDSLGIQGVPVTGIPEIDAINMAANNANIAIWLRPDCVYVAGDICYID